jgi:hypothetical protein
LIKDPEKPYAANTRPISLTNILRRLFEKLMLKKWKTQSWTALHYSQAGFRDGWSVMSNILLSDCLSKSGFGISIFLDLKSAFDEVPFKRLMDILTARGCPRHTRQIIYSLMMQNCSSVITINQSKGSEEIPRMKGLFQGSILSPLLFNLFIDPLALELAERSPKTKTLLFADDIAIKARNWGDAQIAMDICQDWAVKNSQIWGIHKCGVTKTKLIPYVDLKLGDKIIPSCQSYIYLGLPHTGYGIDWRAYLDKICLKSESFITALLTRRTGWAYNTRMTIFKVFIRPSYEYCIPLLYTWIQKVDFKLMKKLDDIHMNGLNFIFNTKKYPRDVLESISGLGSFNHRLKILKASLAKHLRQLDRSNPKCI